MNSISTLFFQYHFKDSFSEKTFYYQSVSQSIHHTPPICSGRGCTYPPGKSVLKTSTGLGGASSWRLNRSSICLTTCPYPRLRVRASQVSDRHRDTLCPSDNANCLIKLQGFWQFPRKGKSETLILPEVPTYFLWSHTLSSPHNCVFKYLVRLALIVFCVSKELPCKKSV